MASLGDNPVRTKIVIDSHIMDSWCTLFKYLGCDISYEYDNDIEKDHIHSNSFVKPLTDC